MELLSEIRAAISAFENDLGFGQLKQRWEKDFDYARLKPYNAGEGYQSYTSNAPKIIVDKTVSLLNSSNLLIRIPEDTLTEEERTTANNVERFLYGAMNLNDERRLTIPDLPSTRQLKSWYATVRGGFAESILVHKEKKDTIPDINVWDIYNTRYGVDSNGITWAAYVYTITAAQAKDEYGTQTSGTTAIKVIDFWDKEKNLLFVGDEKRNEFKHGLGYCPVFIFRAGSTPVVHQTNYAYTEQFAGESVLAPNRNLFPALNKTVSDLMTLVRRGVKVPLGVWSADGKKTVEEDIFRVDKGGVISLRTNEKIEPLLPESAPPDMTNFLNFLVGESQRGAYSHTSYGELGFRLSGYAISQLQEALATTITPFVDCLEKSYLVECLELLRQYANKPLPAIKVRGRTSRNQAFGYPKADTIKPSDIKGDWHPEVTLESVLPKDDAQRVEMARLLREGDVPLLSDETIRSDMLSVRDPDLEQAKIDREWSSRQEINRLFSAYLQFMEDGQAAQAVNVLAQLTMLTSSMGLPSPQGKGVSPAKKMEKGTGMSASTMPAESLGGVPPGAANANPTRAAEGV